MNAKARQIVGIDIGTNSIKAVKMKLSNNEAELCSATLEQPTQDVKEVLKKIKQSYGVDAVNMSLSGSSTVIRYVSFPRMSQGELKQALKFEAQKHIPFPVQDVNIDGYILKEGLPDNKMLVLIAAVKKDLVNQRIKLMEDIGFKVKTVDLDSLAVVNCFKFNYAKETTDNKVVALLNIGATISNLSILDNSIIRLSRDIYIAGNNFTQKIADTLNIDSDEAEAVKMNPNKEKLNNINLAIDSVLSNLAGEIRTSFDFYESQNTSSVVKIFLSGGSSEFVGLKDMLANILGIEVQQWDPLNKIKLATSIDPLKIKTFAGRLAVAVGLGLR